MTRLQFNPDPIRVVPDAVRDVWFKAPIDPSRYWHCFHEDRRGQCRRTVRWVRWDTPTRQVVSYCDRHKPEGG